MKIQYIDKCFNTASLETIEIANEIIEDYAVQGFDLTLRQLYYQLVSRDLIRNHQKEYDRLGRLISDARLCGLVDWSAIVDRTRNVSANPHWRNIKSIMRSALHSFQMDKWSNQEYRPEVWIEKDALRGVISGVCSELDIPHFACRGYNSQSEMWRASQRMINHINNGQQPYIIHLGDHDPSGIDMTRDIIDRLNMFLNGQGYCEVERIALNYDQVEEHNPPPNPAKLSDTRAGDYIVKFGSSSWELDALEPSVIVNLIRDEVLSIRDIDAWDEAVREEQAEIDKLKEVINERL